MSDDTDTGAGPVVTEKITVETREPSWLVKDFNVLYRAAKRFSDACSGGGEDAGRPFAAHQELKAQLERLAPAFTDTEEIRKAGS